MRRAVTFVLAAGLAAATAWATPEPVSSSDILQELNEFRQMGSVLIVAAHPDDENSPLIAYLARGRFYRTAYLSINRGDGGQNLIGPEIGDELGVIRTQELLAARRIDGGQQFFTRAVDFGYSKDYRETFRFWNEKDVLGDVVRVVRTFRPDVIVNIFSTEPARGQHGHHTASAILGLEAFKLAGDTNAYPEQLSELQPWQPKRIVQNLRFGPRGGGGGGGSMQLDAGGYSALLGRSYGEIAALSRSQHKTQGFGNVGTRGPVPNSFNLLDGAPASKDLMDGVDTTWNRIPGGAPIATAVDDVIAHFDAQNPAASVPALVKIHQLLDGLPSDPVLDGKRQKLNHILQSCLGLYVDTTLARADVVPGETMRLQHHAILRVPLAVQWLGVRYPGQTNLVGDVRDLQFNVTSTRSEAKTLPADTLVTQPYWLREKKSPGQFKVADPSLIGRPENPPVYPIEQVFAVDGEQFTVPDEPQQITGDPVKGEVHRALEVVPPVSLDFTDNLTLFAPGAARTVVVVATAARANVSGKLSLDAPSNWNVSPASQDFTLANEGDKQAVTFTLTAPPASGEAEIVARADVGGASWHYRREEIRYDHIPPQLLQPPAELKALSLDLAIHGQNIGYLPGAGDLVAEAMGRMGYHVQALSEADLDSGKLAGLDAIVIGIRAFNVRPGLAERWPALLNYATNGGNVIVLYNRPAGGGFGGGGGGSTLGVAPYTWNVSNDRVTDETATMTLLDPASPLFNSPNKIVPADFDGWVQERGAYFANQWDAAFKPMIACNDPGEAPMQGGLLVASCGQGHLVYTGLSWFRQLPDGTPGAYRLFANLISLGK